MEKHRKPLLAEETDELLQLRPLVKTYCEPATRPIIFAYLAILHLVVCLLAAFLILGERKEFSFYLDELNSPAASVIDYTTKIDRSNGTSMSSQYTGQPNPINNRAWEKLIRPLAFNASMEEMIASGAPMSDSIKLASGGYLASFGVYHELHCLRRMRLWLYRDIYFPNATQEDMEFLTEHLDHCIEILRISSMCNVDLGLYSFFWGPEGSVKPQPRSTSPRKCVDWDLFQTWSENRMVSLQPLLYRPSVHEQ